MTDCYSSMSLLCRNDPVNEQQISEVSAFHGVSIYDVISKGITKKGVSCRPNSADVGSSSWSFERSRLLSFKMSWQSFRWLARNSSWLNIKKLCFFFQIYIPNACPASGTIVSLQKGIQNWRIVFTASKVKLLLRLCPDLTHRDKEGWDETYETWIHMEWSDDIIDASLILLLHSFI